KKLLLLIFEEPNNSDIVMQTLFGARITSNIGIGYVCKHTTVKKPITRGQLAGIRNKSYFEVSQRLNTGDLNLAYLVGLVEGDGWFSISKKGEYLLYEFGIELGMRDVQLIYKIKDLLGVGVVSFRKTKTRPETVFFRIRKKSHLIDIILPIFDKYSFLSNKQYDYLRFRSALLSDIKLYKDLPPYVRPQTPLNSLESILNVPYLSAWLIGFMEAEACFSVYKPTIDPSFVASFDISQTDGYILILAISKYLSLTQSVIVDKTNSSKLKVSSVRSVENVIKFIQNAPVKFQGYKKLQYLLWLKQLRTIPRYAEKFKIPNKY
uniref:hypothetical protein n=1 Tax=Drechslerella dactyloides TaxID=74499 RepID=UPI0022FD4471